MCLALWASRLWLRYTALQNVIPSFPWIAPAWGRKQILQSGNLDLHQELNGFENATFPGILSVSCRIRKNGSQPKEPETKMNSVGGRKQKLKELQSHPKAKIVFLDSSNVKSKLIDKLA